MSSYSICRIACSCLRVRFADTRSPHPAAPARAATTSRRGRPARDSRAAVARPASGRTRTRTRDLDGPLDRPRPACEPALLLAAALRRCANDPAGSQPSTSSSERRARTAASAVASGRRGGRRVVHVVGRDHFHPARSASCTSASLRCRSSGSPWSHNSTSTRSRPNAVDQLRQVPPRPPPDRRVATRPARSPCGIR